MDSLRLQSRTTVDIEGGSIVVGGFVNTKDLDHPIFQILDQKSIDGGGFARVELAGALAGLPVGPVRLPLVDATPEQVDVLRADLAGVLGDGVLA